MKIDKMAEAIVLAMLLTSGAVALTIGTNLSRAEKSADIQWMEKSVEVAGWELMRAEEVGGRLHEYWSAEFERRVDRLNEMRSVQ